MAEETGTESTTPFDTGAEENKTLLEELGGADDGVEESPYQSALFTILATIQDTGQCTELEARTALSAEGIEGFYEEVQAILATIVEDEADPGAEQIDFKGVSQALEESILEEEADNEETLK